MNRKSIAAIVIVLMAFMVSDAMAGPFGLRKGMSLKEIVGKQRGQVYTLDKT